MYRIETQAQKYFKEICQLDVSLVSRKIIYWLGKMAFSTIGLVHVATKILAAHCPISPCRYKNTKFKALYIAFIL